VVDRTMRGACLEANDHHHFLGALPQLLRPYRQARRVHLILDHDASHIALPTQAYLAAQPTLRAVYTPAHASWLNQAELLLRAFGGRYLDRLDVPSRQAPVGHLGLSWPEYNRRYAHPFTWSWSRHAMHAWATAHKDAVVCSKTFATVHWHHERGRTVVPITSRASHPAAPGQLRSAGIAEPLLQLHPSPSAIRLPKSK
jgi:hypothetical protein